MAAINVRRLGYALGAEITGLDLTRPLDSETVAAVRKAWIDHIVLCIPGQDLDLNQMQAFCSNFGSLNEFKHDPSTRHPEHPTVKLVVNQPLTVDGKTFSGRTQRENGATKWHSDQSYTLFPGEATFLLAKDVPEVGGDTMFANMYMAYESLSPAMQQILEGLSCVHDRSMITTHTPEQREEDRRRHPAVVHPAIFRHPESGRKALFVNPRVQQFEGMTFEESRPIIDFLCKQSVAYEFSYRHRWHAGDLVMWDNRCATHIAVQDYDQSQLRRMLRCSSLGEKRGHLYSERELASV